jgi:CubicO group peptidase (beta-lactamase class C family)
MHLRRLAAAGIATFFPLAAPAAVPATFDAAVQELGRTWLTENDGIGLTIGVYDGGQRHFYNFGATRLDGDRLPTKDTVYEIGSVTKTLTAQLLARAVVEDRARLEDVVTKYLEGNYPNLARNGEPIRLLHLANMTSQLVDNIPDVTQVRKVEGVPLASSKMQVFDRYKRADFLRQLYRVVPRGTPGADPGHSNVAAMLLGVVLEKIYGEPFDAILTREIEKPLRMSSGTRPATRLLARGYTKDNEELPTYEAPISWPSVALRYSADDLLKYAAWQMAEKDASVKLAHRPTWTTPDQRESIAMYWLVSQSAHGRRLNYSGRTYGFTSVCDLYPEAGVAIVLLSNKDTDGAQGSLRALSVSIAALARPAG